MASPMLHAVGGGVGGAVSLALTYPLYTVVMRLQSLHGGAKKNTMLVETKSSGRSEETRVLMGLQRTLAISRTIIKEEGVRGLYKGAPAGILAVGAQCFVYYYFLARFKILHRVSTQALCQLLVGFEAGVATVFMTHPLWIINYKQTTDSKRESTWIRSFLDIIRSKGIAGLYDGVLPAIVLCVNPGCNSIRSKDHLLPFSRLSLWNECLLRMKTVCS